MPVGLPRAGQVGARSKSLSPLERLISFLRSTGGQLYMAGPANRIASDGSGPVAVAGDAIGYARDSVVGTNNAVQTATSAKPRLMREPVLGPELLVNGDFSTGDTTGWHLNGATASVSSGVLTITGTATNQSLDQGSSAASGKITAGKSYFVSIDMKDGTAPYASALVAAGPNGGYGTVGYLVPYITNVNGFTRYQAVVTAISNDLTVALGRGGAGTAMYDNASVKEITSYTDRWYWSFDGSDDKLQFAVPAGLTPAGDWVMCAATIDMSDGPVNRDVLALYGVNDSVMPRLHLRAYDTYTYAIGYNAAGTKVIDVFVTGHQTNTPYVLTLRKTGTTVQLRRNGGAWATITGVAMTGSFVYGGIGSTSGNVGARSVPSVVVSPGTFTDAQVQQIEREVGRALGVAL